MLWDLEGLVLGCWLLSCQGQEVLTLHSKLLPTPLHPHLPAPRSHDFLRVSTDNLWDSHREMGVRGRH